MRFVPKSKRCQRRALTRSLWLLLPLILPLASCATIGHSDGCDWDRAIYVSPKDSLTDPTAKQILEHNKTGAKVCGWKPRSNH